MHHEDQDAEQRLRLQRIGGITGPLVLMRVGACGYSRSCGGSSEVGIAWDGREVSGGPVVVRLPFFDRIRLARNPMTWRHSSVH